MIFSKMSHETIRTYNQMAKEYDDETVDFWQRFPRTFFDRFAELAKGNVIDIGSGPGRDALILKEKGIDVTCLDASEKMIELCKERGLRGVVGDFNALPFKDNSFGGAWAYTSLLHVPKAEVSTSFREIARVLKAGGILGLGLIEGTTEGYRESSGVHLPRWFSFYTKEEVERLLSEHDFEVLMFDQFKPSSKNYLNFIARKK